MQTHPMKKQSPPRGVIGPRKFFHDSIPVNSLVDNKYIDPEKNKIPAMKNIPANLRIDELIRSPNK